MGFSCYCHGASAADLTTRGYADIVVADPFVAKEPYMLRNNKDGTFTADHSVTPTGARQWSFPYQTQTYGVEIYSVELIDFNNDNKFDWFMAGAEDSPGQSAGKPVIYMNSGNNNFSSVTPLYLPTGGHYSIALDIVFAKGKIVLLRVDRFYNDLSLQEIDLATLSQKTVFTTSNRPGLTWLAYSNDTVSSLELLNVININL